MRPVNRLDGNYDANSKAFDLFAPGIRGFVVHDAIRCLALCIEEEIRRLSFIIQVIPAPLPAPTTVVAANALHAPVAVAVAAGAGPMAGFAAAIAAAAGAGTPTAVKAAIEVLPIATKRRIAADIITVAATAGAAVVGGATGPLVGAHRTIAEITRAATLLPAAPILGPAYDPANIIYDAAIQGLPANIRTAVNNYIHYLIIRRNLAYRIRNGNFLDLSATMGVRMVVADIPYAISAMQDAREILRAAGGANQLYAYSTAAAPASVVTVGPLPVPPPGAVAITEHYSLANITSHISYLYDALYLDVNANPSPYTDATNELLDELGAYCTYCEARFVSEVNVEHILPKGKGNQDNLSIYQGFPSLAKSWLNFLPACGRCNSTKNARPTKHEITVAAIGPPAAAFTKDDNTVLAAPLATVVGGGTVGGDRRITDQEYARLYQDYYQFPLDAASYQNVGFLLYDVTIPVFGAPGAPYTATAIPNQRTWTIQKVDEIKKEVIVNTPGILPAVRKFEVHIDQWNVPADALLPTVPAAQPKVERMSDICGLNSTWADGDRRVVERTEAWFMALEAVNRIVTDLAGLPGGTPAAVYNRVYALWRDNTIRLIKEKGFFSVWLKIFTQFAHPLAGTPGALPTFPAAPALLGVFLPMIGGGAVGGPGAAAPVRGAAIGNLAQDIAQTILQTGEGVNDAAQNAAGIALGIAPPVPPAVIPMAGAAGVGLAATWAAAGAPARAQAEAAARKAGAARSRFFPNTNWDQVP